MSHQDINQQRRDILRLLGLGGAASLGLLSVPLWAASPKTQISQVRMSSDNDLTRVVFDLSHPVNYNLMVLHEPERLVIDFDHAQASHALSGNNALVRAVRQANRNQHDYRVVLDLNAKVQPKSFLLPPDASHPQGYRLVVDLKQNTSIVKSAANRQLRDLVVVIDPGHGGKDPGAIGKRGTYEKDVVLAIATKLATQLDKERGIKALLTRNNDTYLGLRERTNIANRHKADLFISVHADASTNPKVSGASVYTLSEGGATSEMARKLALTQNGVDPEIANTDLSGKSREVASLIVDLSKNRSMQSSTLLAEKLLAKFEHKLHDTVESAGFAVLKSLDIPSVLIETAFISNPAQENLLRSAAFQNKMAGSINSGILSYFKQYAPSDSIIASIHRGNSLANI